MCPRYVIRIGKNFRHGILDTGIGYALEQLTTQVPKVSVFLGSLTQPVVARLVGRTIWTPAPCDASANGIIDRGLNYLHACCKADLAKMKKVDSSMRGGSTLKQGRD